MSAASKKILLAFYGDDFTGSSDALEFLSRAGARTVLFIDPPTTQQLARYDDLDALGVAGITRSMVPSGMEQVLVPAFTALREIGPRHVHYKVCSTFDSSPAIGSIGKAIDTGTRVFNAPFVPLLVAAPALGRYCVFGNLFAQVGIGSDGDIFRLDRHPSMSRHPVTPADESDLRLHLAKQTNKPIALMDILQVVKEFEPAKVILQNMIDKGAKIVLLDALYETQLKAIGKLIDSYAGDNSTLFSVGSSGIEMALGKLWQEQGLLNTKQYPTDAGKVSGLLVISGSCSNVTSRQIKWALHNGFVGLPLDTDLIASTGDFTAGLDGYVKDVSEHLKNGRSVVLHTSTGNDDLRLASSSEILAGKGFKGSMLSQQTSKLFGSALGAIVLRVAQEVTLKRIVIAGGDTSGYAARAMKLEAVEMIAEFSPGAPLCKAHAPGSPLHGIELTIKGGQVGGDDYFGMVQNGKFTINRVTGA